MIGKVVLRKSFIKILKSGVFVLFSVLVTSGCVWSQQADSLASSLDSTFKKGILDSSLKNMDPILAAIGEKKDFNLDIQKKQPFITVQQMTKGTQAGLYVQEPSGEPGTEQYMYVRGLAKPLFSKQDVYDQQPVVFINGIPIMNPTGMELGIQKSELNIIGPATNLLSIIDASAIESIEVLKDPAVLGKLGPVAANGAIWITTKNAHSGKKEITVDSYFGVVQNNNVTPVNGAYENAFRQPFYKKYASVNELINYPTYLRDSTDLAYYGPANWTDLYFKNALIYGASASLTGGTERANFRFSLNNERSASGQDASRLDRYGFSFFINMSPLRWLTVSSMISGNRLKRDRNRNFRDRLTETRYVPEMTNPLSPGKDLYGAYLKEFEKVIDDNKLSSIQGYFSVSLKPVNNFSFLSKLAVDYNERVRDVFWPTTLIDNNNFISNYSGYSQRFMLSNVAQYQYDINQYHNLAIEVGQQFQADVNKYDYGFGYNTPNDFIKVRGTMYDNSGNYVTLFSMPYFPTVDKMNHRLASFYGQLSYSYKSHLTLSATIRRDGSSYVQPNNRWLTTPVLNIKWDIKNSLSVSNGGISAMSLRASYGRFGMLFNTDKFSVGPNYIVDLGWKAEPHIGSYVGIGASSRPYTKGWVGYGLGWQYADKLNLGFDLGLFNNRLMAAIDLYTADNKNMVLPLSVPKEYGYSVAYESGMVVNNKGVDVNISASVFDNPNGFSWLSSLNFNTNQNKLTALPNNMEEVVINDRYLKVGQPIDAFWLYQNQGIYDAISDIPVNGKTGVRQSFRGIELNPGDPRWKDINGDYNIDDKDKVLTGHALPVFTGGWGNTFSYKKIELGCLFYFAAGHKMLNIHVANRMNFINNEGAKNPEVAKEITFWQKTFDPSTYPLYNPWSDIIPYRADQDLFLQDASFIKLRSLSLAYDLVSERGLFKKGVFNKSLLYISATNLFTLSKIKDFDPELINYQGYYTGHSQYIPRTYTIGIKLNF